MELHRINLPSRPELDCAHPGGQYAEAQRYATLKAMKSDYKLGVGFTLKFNRWILGIMLAGIAVASCFIADPKLYWIVGFVAFLFLLLGGLNERGAWLHRRAIAQLEASGGQTELEKETLSSPFFSACHTVSTGAGDALNAAWRWNAYVERVKVGSTNRFEDDVAVGRDIEERLSAILELDPLVYRLYRDDRQYRWEIAQTPNKVERPSYVSSERALKRLDLSVAASAEAWLKSLLERHPELVSP